MKRTLVVNLIGGPGVGKSTTMAALFSKLKQNDVDCEQVTEFAKELVWEARNETFKDELYIFAKQAHRLFRINGKVDIVVTDRPLILTCYYAQGDKPLCDLCYSEFSKYYSLNIFLEREKVYNPNGRNQTEDQAKEVDIGLKKVLEDYNIPYRSLPGNSESIDEIYDMIMTLYLNGFTDGTLN